MANFRKSFSFRNGVQVDDDNLIVNANGLVGIGTSVPTELFDVRGTTKVVGLVTATEVFTPQARVGVLTVTSVTDGKLTIRSGVISATTGVITFFGDGAGLYNIPTSQWIDVDSGLGYTSIYAAGAVGVGTTNPVYWFQVGRNPDTDSGVGFNSLGSIKASGIITASSFRGPLTGSVTGNLVGNVNSTGLSTFASISVTGNTNSTGIITATRIDGNHTGIVNANVNATGVSTLPFVNSTNINATGVITATSFSGPITGTVTGIAQSASSLTGTPSITVANIIATSLNAGFTTTGIGTVTNTFHVGNGGTAFSALNSGRIGVGTAIPSSDAQIRKTHATLLEVVSDNNRARISIGQSVGVGNSSAVLRFADTAKVFDVINNDTGNLNMVLHGGGVGVNTGRFNWIYGQTNAELMSLTYGGKLGIAKTNPDETLHVVGTSTVTGNAWFGGNVTILGSINIPSLPLPPVFNNIQINNTSGVSTFSNLLISPSIAGVGSIGIGTSVPIVDLDGRDQDAFFGRLGINTGAYGIELFNVNGASRFGSVGIGTSAATTGVGFITINEIEQYNSTTRFVNSPVFIRGSAAGAAGLGVGTDSLRCAADFSDAGKDNPGIGGGEQTGSRAYMILPSLNSTQRGVLVPTNGALIYNTSSSQFQGYTNSSWIDIGITTALISANTINVSGVTTVSTIEIGGVNDTTISRVSAGRIAVEGVNVVTTSSSDTLSNKTISFTSNTISFTSAELATACSNETGSGSLVFATSPTLVTPTLGAASATSLTVGTAHTISAPGNASHTGIVTAGTGFLSNAGGSPVRIYRNGTNVVFEIVGVGSATLALV